MRNFFTEKGITKRQLEVIECKSRGLSNQEAAHELGVKDLTIKFHLSRIFWTLKIKTSLELIAFYYIKKEELRLENKSNEGLTRGRA